MCIQPVLQDDMESTVQVNVCVKMEGLVTGSVAGAPAHWDGLEQLANWVSLTVLRIKLCFFTTFQLTVNANI